jgi:putative restriction endonuclease
LINFLDSLAKLNVNRNGTTISLHKPLLLLLLISEVKKGNENRFAYTDIEPRLKRLLQNFGLKNTKTFNPHLPFIHLASDDNLWTIEGPRIAASGSKPANRSDIKDAFGYLSTDFFEFLQNSSNTTAAISGLLIKYWTEAYHADILSELGLDDITAQSALTSVEKSKRSKAFVDHVMDAYERKCAICHQSIRLGDALIGIDACHVRPIQHNGDDNITNGIALCKIHHWALDRGAIALTNDLTLQVSSKLNGHKTDDYFFQFDGKEIFTPRNASFHLHELNTSYHRKYIFAG